MFVISHEVTSADLAKGHIPLGKPIDNCQLFVVDDHVRPVEPGTEGELVIAGARVGGGYCNNSIANATSFVNLPHIPVKIIPTGSPCPAYRTGDIVQVNESGLYDFVGRRDCQVKITGHRVELEGLENIFLRTNLVSAAAVVKVNPKEAGTGPVLVAYVVPENSLVDGKSIGQAFIELAPHLLAPRVEVLAKLPLGKKGKCDRKRLEQLYVQKMAEVFHQKKTMCRVNSHSVEICLE